MYQLQLDNLQVRKVLIGDNTYMYAEQAVLLALCIDQALRVGYDYLHATSIESTFGYDSWQDQYTALL